MLLQFGGRTVAGLRRAAKIPNVGKRTTRHPGRRSFFTSSIRQDAPTISGIPERSLVDEGLSVEIAGLDPDVKAVTLHLNVNNSSNLDYDSTASFSVGPSGKLSLDKQTPILWSTPIPTEDYGGTMDLFRSLKAKGGSPNQRFWSSDVALPYNCTLSVHGGVRGGADKLVGEKPLASAHFKRSLLAKGVKRKDLRQGRVVATMFVPESATACAPKPCVFTIHGGHNRRKIVEDNAALMASRLGFPTIALAFFGVETLPQKLLEQDIDVGYFEEAIDLATSMDEVRTEGGVGLWGISKGGEVCLGLSALLGEKIGAAVIVNCVMKPVGVGFSYRGAQVLKPQALESSADAQPKILGENLLSIAGTDGKFLSRDDKIIPFHKSSADLLFVAGSDDQLCVSAEHADLAVEVMQEHGKENYQVLKYPGLGHLLDLPYSPVTYESFHPFVPPPLMLDTGGRNLAQHSFAQEDSWNKILDFFKTRLQ